MRWAKESARLALLFSQSILGKL